MFLHSALSDNEPVYAQVERHHKTARTPERSQRTHRRHQSACVQVPAAESPADGADIPVHEQLVNDLTANTESLSLAATRREYNNMYSSTTSAVAYIYRGGGSPGLKHLPVAKNN